MVDRGHCLQNISFDREVQKQRNDIHDERRCCVSMIAIGSVGLIGRRLNSKALINVLYPIRHPTIDKILQDIIDKSNEYKPEIPAVDSAPTPLKEK